jgi:transcriptional regulator with XRE-family HTH domain
MAKSKNAPPLSRIGDYIRRQRELANVSLHKVAEQSGVSSAVLKEIESGLRQPSKTLLQSLAGALRLSAETLFLQAGVIDPQEEEDLALIREIRRDPHITPHQRDILIDIYHAFCAANRARHE